MPCRQPLLPFSRFVVAVVASLLAGAPAVVGTARAGGSSRPGPGRAGLELSFVAVGDVVAGLEQGARVELGVVSALPDGRSGAGARRGAVVMRRIAIRLDAPAGGAAVARLEAALADEPQGWSVRVDGLPLSTVPRVVDPVHRVGSAVLHVIEIVVPPDAPAGALESTILWTADGGG